MLYAKESQEWKHISWMHTGKLNIEVYRNSDRNMCFTPNGNQKTVNLPSTVGYLSREILKIIIPL